MTSSPEMPVTQLLAAVRAGDAGAQDRLWSLIYDELRRLAHHQMAAEAPGPTLQPTALLHEAYFRLFGENHIEWDNRHHFFATAAKVMRQIRIDDARNRKRIKRGGGRPVGDLPDDRPVREQEAPRGPRAGAVPRGAATAGPGAGSPTRKVAAPPPPVSASGGPPSAWRHERSTRSSRPVYCSQFR